MPNATPYAIACVRLATLNLRTIFLRWKTTVASEMFKIMPISKAVFPFAAQVRQAFSFGVIFGSFALIRSGTKTLTREKWEI
jgi:hypothetical protein